MTDENAELTLTPCSTCGKTSETNEQMVGCDSCKGWFHCRCVNATEADLAETKWFCSADECQRQKKVITKKTSKSSKKTPGNTSDSDRSSVKSDRQVGSNLSRIMQKLQEEQKSKEEELQMERIMREKRIEMELSFKKKRLAMEKQLREKEMKLEKEMLEESLAREKEHLDRLKRMRLQYQTHMDQVQQEIKQVKTANDAGKNPGTAVQNPSVNGKDSKPAVNKASDAPDGSNSKPSTQGEHDSESDSDRSDDSDETSDSESSEVETDEEESDSDQEKQVDEKETARVKPRAKPSRAQLAARNGITKKLPVFTGKPEEWPLFIGAFEASTEACSFSDVENLVRLQESLKGPALESVRCQLLFPKSVPRVIKKLRQMYGRPKQLLQCHLDRIRRLESPKADKLASYVPFGNAVEQLYEHLKMAGLKQHLVNPLLIQDLVGG